jgi:hypothetical protein
MDLLQTAVGRRQVLYVCYFHVRTLPEMCGQIGSDDTGSSQLCGAV